MYYFEEPIRWFFYSIMTKAFVVWTVDVDQYVYTMFRLVVPVNIYYFENVH